MDTLVTLVTYHNRDGYCIGFTRQLSAKPLYNFISFTQKGDISVNILLFYEILNNIGNSD